MRKIINCCFVLFIGIQSFSQGDRVGKKQVRSQLQTDVFILDNQEPSRLSLIRKFDDSTIVDYGNPARLSVSTKRFSSFKIIHINPLRYSFYINNELVTQFFDEKNIFPENNSFLNKAYFPIQDLQKLEIFKTEDYFDNKSKILNPIKEKIKVLQNEINRLKSLHESYYQYQVRPLQTYDPDTRSFKVDKKKQAVFQQKSDSLEKFESSISTKERELSQLFLDYESELSSLPINNKNFTAFDNYNLSKYEIQESDTLQGLGQIIAKIHMFSKVDSINAASFATIISVLSDPYLQKKLSNDYIPFGTTATSEVIRNYEKLKNLLAQYGFAPNWPSLDDNYSNRYQNKQNLLIDIKEFVIRKKYQNQESNLVAISAAAGKLLQDKYIEYSQKLNLLRRKGYLTEADVIEAKEISRSLKNVFRFIQDISADFSVIVRHLDLDNNGFKNIINNINKYYVELLGLLKFFDVLDQDNTVDFTLPTHTNLKNVDLIRYKIDRTDKVTESRQTYVYDLWLKGGLKIDFSAGIFRSQLQDHVYEKAQFINSSGNASADTIEVNRKDNGGADFAFGGMVNISPRVGASWVNGGISFGIVYSENQKLQFLGAVSLQLGKTERISLHYGYAMGFIQTLDRSQFTFSNNPLRTENKDFVLKASLGEFSIPYVQKFSMRPFFGISYNLSKRNAFQAVSNKGNDFYNNLIKPKADGASN